MRILLIMLSVTACTTNQSRIGPTGKESQSITCPRNMDNCYEKAADLCPQGYNILNSTNESGFNYSRFNILVECK